jgi:hypothetical protein
MGYQKQIFTHFTPSGDTLGDTFTAPKPVSAIIQSVPQRITENGKAGNRKNSIIPTPARLAVF